MQGFDTSVFPKLDYDRPDRFNCALKDMENFFVSFEKELQPVREKALIYKEAFFNLDSFIQSFTSSICPYCGTVCCAHQHGLPELADIVGLLAMDLKIPEYDLSLERGGMCQFMGEKGCVLPRHHRPYRCTWYFCDPLLVQIEIGPPRQYRTFIKDVEGLAKARGNMLSEFYPLWSRHSKNIDGSKEKSLK